MPVTVGRTITQIVVTQAAAGATDLVAIPGAGMRIYVVGFFIALDLAGSIKFTEGTGPTDLTGVIPIATSNYIDVWADGNEPVIATNTANAKLSITTVTGKAFGWLRYYIA